MFLTGNVFCFVLRQIVDLPEGVLQFGDCLFSILLYILGRVDFGEQLALTGPVLDFVAG